MFDLLRKNRLRLGQDLRDREKRKLFSPALYSLDDSLLGAIDEFAHGNLIDIGCGDMPYRSVIEARVERYDTIDREIRGSRPTYLGDIQDMRMIDSGRYDSALCLSVLEHIPRPTRVLEEIHRILAAHGNLILTVPCLSRLHEQPHDYYRYTEHGLRFLLGSTGFEILRLEPTAGIFSFLGHQISTAFLCSVWHLPVIKQLAFGLNLLLVVKTCALADEALKTHRLVPMGYLCVARKKPKLKSASGDG